MSTAVEKKPKSPIKEKALPLPGGSLRGEIPGWQEDGYNIDHVVIGPGGVFAIETKTRRKRGNQSVVFDGESVLVAGFKPDRDPIQQARASATRVRDILKQQTGKDVWVKPVVLFPGWFVEIRKRVADVFVGNEKLFLKSFRYEHSEQVYTREDVEELARGVERYVRRQSFASGETSWS